MIAIINKAENIKIIKNVNVMYNIVEGSIYE